MAESMVNWIFALNYSLGLSIEEANVWHNTPSHLSSTIRRSLTRVLTIVRMCGWNGLKIELLTLTSDLDLWAEEAGIWWNTTSSGSLHFCEVWLNPNNNKKKKIWQRQGERTHEHTIDNRQVTDRQTNRQPNLKCTNNMSLPPGGGHKQLQVYF